MGISDNVVSLDKEGKNHITMKSCIQKSYQNFPVNNNASVLQRADFGFWAASAMCFTLSNRRLLPGGNTKRG